MYGLIGASVKANLNPMKVLSALHLYGSVGIASFGVILGRFCGWHAGKFFWLWLAAALLVYNVDRLRKDPADVINTPERCVQTARWRWASYLLVAGSAFVMAVLPILQNDGRLLMMCLAGTAICLCYSLPPKGLRIKDMPLLKTFFAPTLVLAAWLVPPFLEFGQAASPGTLIAWASWVWTLLLFNMVLCDQRDIEGDRRTGIRSLPIWLGQQNTQRLLVLLIVTNAALGLWVLAGVCDPGPGPQSAARQVLVLLAPACMSMLLLAILRKRRGELFYEWAVDGLLYLPLVTWLLSNSPF